MDPTFVRKLLILAALLSPVCYAEVPVESYQNAVKDAAFAEDTENTDNLVAITPNNPDLVWSADKTKVLVVTWKSQSAYEKFIKNSKQTADDPNYAVWVSTAPQLQSFCQHYLKGNPEATKEQLDMRLKQYLGLAPDWNYDVVVELWVKPEHIFRPCVDPEINDTQCQLKVPDKFPAVTNIPDYGQFYQQLYFKSFRQSAGVPWTGLGYTYDWGSQVTEVGASEFILMPKTPYEIKQAVPTRDYCESHKP